LKIKLILIGFFLALVQLSNAQNNSSEFLARSTIGISGSSETISSNNQTYIVQQSIGQTSVIGTFYVSEYIIRQGFIQPLSNLQMDILPSNPLPSEHSGVNLSVAIYPNPFRESITLSFSEKVSGTIYVLVYDLSGRLVFSKDYLTDENVKVEFKNLSMGTYLMRVSTNNKQFIKKIIKNNY